MQSAKSAFRLSIMLQIRQQWKPGLLFACLLIYFKLMIFVCGNSKQFFEEAHIEELFLVGVRGVKPLLFSHCLSCPPGFCVLDTGQAAEVEGTRRTFRSTKDWCVSCHSSDSLRGTAILATSPPAVNWLPGISGCWVEWVGHHCHSNLVDKAEYSFWSWLSRVKGDWPLESLLCGKRNTTWYLCYRLEWLSFSQCTLAIGVTFL